MPVVNTPDGPIETSLPPEAVKDIEITPEAKPAEPAKAPEPVKPAGELTPAEPKPVDPAKPAEPAKTPEPPKGKAKPIANLLSKLNDERTARESLERELAELKAKPAEPAKVAEPAAQDDIDEIAKKHGITDPTLLKDLAVAIRKGVTPSPGLPKEVQDLLAERQAEKAQQAEEAAFNTRADKLATVFKDEPIAQHKDKILELAYSTEKAPDGERYCDKELSEIYFGFIKPTIEPGKPSAEPSRGGSNAGAKVVDYSEIQNDPVAIEAMTSEEFSKFDKWLHSQGQGDVPIKKNR